MAFDTALVTRISKWLDWQVSFSDRYLSNPLPGIKKNDLLLTTGIRITYGGSDQATYQGVDSQNSSSDSSGVNPDKTGPSQPSAAKPSKGSSLGKVRKK